MKIELDRSPRGPIGSRGPLLLTGMLALALGWSGPARADAGYSITDDAAELALSIDRNESLVYLNTFPVDPAGQFIDLIRISYGRVGGPTPLNNQPVRILLYEDQNGGSPKDAVLLWSFDTVVANGNTNILNEYAVPGVLVRGTLVAGYYYKNTNPIPIYIGSLDTTAPTYSQRSFFGYAAAIDPANLGAIPANQFMAQEQSGTAGNYRIEARGRLTQDGIVLTLSKLSGTGSVRLSWTGSKTSYSVERASRPDFSDAAVIGSNLPGPTFDDPVLNDGKNWFYRVK